MNEQAQNLTRAITGPIILITVGVLFLVDRFTGFSFGQTSRMASVTSRARRIRPWRSAP